MSRYKFYITIPQDRYILDTYNTPPILTTIFVSVPLDNCPLCIASLIGLDDGVPRSHNFADAIFPHCVWEKILTGNLTVRNDRFAILPSKIRSSPKFFLISQNPRNSEKCRVASFFEARILEEKKLR